ncbi:hypothetical protein PUNSTDRAFT_138796 [Punctularia strigosozonata HHB-11173 SS5]|uniref:2OGFeDO JBP1/TET oxygenase domain-containing protein n=1 Tax=Punctularia strigosozonata (strain HHB-11173) TaxID=741275 RepID=R7S2G0_PUNST|nr:uncharacterized protein PUNSTDRAFT_138796 [Punctularia strigosozonata HHB-11173 SS5]EIN04393.1 hypothetical protein PUNSTDRAFT_138796 [Punctularia strigosozonata HHB-11173 SS5]
MLVDANTLRQLDMLVNLHHEDVLLDYMEEEARARDLRLIQRLAGTDGQPASTANAVDSMKIRIPSLAQYNRRREANGLPPLVLYTNHDTDDFTKAEGSALSLSDEVTDSIPEEEDGMVHSDDASISDYDYDMSGSDFEFEVGRHAKGSVRGRKQGQVRGGKKKRERRRERERARGLGDEGDGSGPGPAGCRRGGIAARKYWAELCSALEEHTLPEEQGAGNASQTLEAPMGRWIECPPSLQENSNVVFFLRALAYFYHPSNLLALSELVRDLQDPAAFHNLHMASFSPCTSLIKLAKDCYRYSSKSRTLKFFSMLANLRLAVRANEVMAREDFNHAELFRQWTPGGEGQPHRDFYYWLNEGAILARLVSVGGLPMLIMVSILSSRRSLQSMKTRVISEAAEYMVDPPKDAGGVLVRRLIIPALKLINRLVCFHVVFSKTDNLEDMVCLASTNVERTKKYFSSLILNDWILSEHADCWNDYLHRSGSCDFSLIGNYSLAGMVQAPVPDLHAMDIDMDSAASTLPFQSWSAPDLSAFGAHVPEPDFVLQHKHLPFPDKLLKITVPFECLGLHDPLDKKKDPQVKKWTKMHRTLANDRKKFAEFHSFKAYYESLDKPPVHYVETPKLPPNETLEIYDKHGVLCAVLIGHVRQDPELLERTSMLLEANFPEMIRGDSTLPKFKYLSKHCLIYNRYKQRGDDAPMDIHPLKLKTRTGKRHAQRPQRLPEMSQEGQKDGNETEQLLDDLEPLILEVLRVLEHHLPKECVVQATFAKKLPLHDVTPAGPFTGLVVNIAVATLGHRDKKDFEICVVIPLGKWTGGQLVLHELGLVFDLQAGDILWFRSTEITHFNLHFKGCRASIVLTHDADGRFWVRDMNGWRPRIW